LAVDLTGGSSGDDATTIGAGREEAKHPAASSTAYKKVIPPNIPGFGSERDEASSAAK
jgi:hypothetical protein